MSAAPAPAKDQAPDLSVPPSPQVTPIEHTAEDPPTLAPTRLWICNQWLSLDATEIVCDFSIGHPRTLEALPWLRRLSTLALDLDIHEAEDLEPLSELPRLTSLSLGLAKTTRQDLNALKPLTSLSTLSIDLSQSKISDLSALSVLPNISTLSIDLTKGVLDDLNPIKGLERLRSLSLSGADATAIQILSALPSLTSLELGLPRRDKTVQSLDTVIVTEGLRRLAINCDLPTRPRSACLSLPYTSIHSLDGLTKIKELNTLDLELNAKVKDLSFLETLETLKTLKLDLRRSKVDSIRPLAHLSALTHLTLDLSSSGVWSVDALASLGALESLELVLNYPIKRVEALASMAKLRHLTIDLSTSQVKGLPPLDALTQLTTLRVDTEESKQLTTLAALSELTNLERLAINCDLPDEPGHACIRLQRSKLRDLDFLAGLKKIHTIDLDLRESQVQTLSVFTQLDQLEHLRLVRQRSQVQDLSPLSGSKNLKSLHLIVSNRFLGDLELLRHLVHLERLAINCDLPEHDGRACIRARGASPDLTFFPALRGITSLHLRLQGKISALTSIESLTHLETFELDLLESKVLDVSPLSVLQDLKALRLSASSVRLLRLESLLKLTNLERFAFDCALPLHAHTACANLGRNAGRRPHFFTSFPNITRLRLELFPRRSIDLTSLGAVEQLQRLAVNCSLPQVERGICINHSAITGLETLARLSETSELAIGYESGRADDLVTMPPFPSLRSLSLNLRYREDDLSLLKRFPTLTSLDLDLSSNVRLTALDPLSTLRALETLRLDLSHSDLSDIDALRSLIPLTALNLNLRFGHVTSIEPLRPLTKLRVLSLSAFGTSVSALDSLAELTALESLSLVVGECEVDDLAPLRALQSLTDLKLDLRLSFVRSLLPLADLDQLRSLELDLRKSPMQDLSPLTPLKNLKTLKLSVSAGAIDREEITQLRRALPQLERFDIVVDH